MPRRHPDIDGSGTVKKAKQAPERLSQGATFGMSMEWGIRYSMVSTVIEFEDDKRIAWQAAPSGFVNKIIGGRIWRDQLEPVEGGTLVKESWDISEDHQRAFLKLGSLPTKTQHNMERTLARIEELVATPS